VIFPPTATLGLLAMRDATVQNPVNAADRLAQVDQYEIDVHVVGINPN
jgi:hypothetical protein